MKTRWDCNHRTGHIRLNTELVTKPAYLLEKAGIRVIAERDVVVQQLKQAVPGQLGQLTRRMAEAGVNIEVSTATIITS